MPMETNLKLTVTDSWSVPLPLGLLLDVVRLRRHNVEDGGTGVRIGPPTTYHTVDVKYARRERLCYVE